MHEAGRVARQVGDGGGDLLRQAGPDWLRCSRRAAADRLPSSATTAKARSSRISTLYRMPFTAGNMKDNDGQVEASVPLNCPTR